MAILPSERIIDADGHVLEDAQAIKDLLPEEWRQEGIANFRLFNPWPELDHMHLQLSFNPPGAFGDPKPNGWTDFMDTTGFTSAVLYPTMMLAAGQYSDVEIAIGACKAYNNWLHQNYLSKDTRLKGVAVLPIQDPEAAADELRRCISELGFSAGMLPSTRLQKQLGHKQYWPIYEEADSLGCAIAIHGGAHAQLGLDNMEVFAGIHALGHPVGIGVNFVGMLLHRTFELFPNTKFGFLEGGAGWFVMALERCSGSYGAFVPFDSRNAYLKLEKGQTVTDYAVRIIKEGRLYVGVEGDEPVLGWAVKNFGKEAFMFSSDFPHEVNKETIREEIEGLMERDDLTSEEKSAILYGNAEQFYSLQGVTAAR